MPSTREQMIDFVVRPVLECVMETASIFRTGIRYEADIETHVLAFSHHIREEFSMLYGGNIVRMSDAG